MREARSSPPAHRGARVIRTDALHFVLILREPRDGQERKQDSEDDPDINAHQSSGSVSADTQKRKKAPGVPLVLLPSGRSREVRYIITVR
jgi:hypothetical protein